MQHLAGCVLFFAQYYVIVDASPFQNFPARSLHPIIYLFIYLYVYFLTTCHLFFAGNVAATSVPY